MPKDTKKKRKRLRVVLPIIGVVLILVIIVVSSVLYATTPTKGDPIAGYNEPKAALLVIDVQNDTTSNTAFYGDTTRFLENVNQAIAFAEENDMEILYVKNITGNNPVLQLLAGGKYKDGTVGAELADGLQIASGNIFTKSIRDSFSDKGFEDYLISKQVDTLYIVGADASACILSTAQGGINRNYNVNIISDAIITVNDTVMAQMLEQYTKDGAVVIDLAQLFNHYEIG